MGYIYKITNIQNNKIYIGKTKYSIYNRFESHIRAAFKSNRKYYFYNAIRKYGKDNFKIDLIEECDNSILSEREKYWISFYNSIDKSIGYNSTLGGEGGDTFTYQSKERQKEISAKKSQSMTGKSRKPLTIEQRKRISEGHLGQVAWNKGLTKETDERIKQISESLKHTNNYKRSHGIIISTGKAKTEEKENLRRQKISRGMKGIRNGVGNRSLKGQKWIHKDKERKTVLEKDLEEYLNNGWELGMGKRN